MLLQNLDRISIFLKDDNKKPIALMVWEFMNLWFTKGEIPYYYFKHLYKRDIENIYDYLGTQEGALIHSSKFLHNISYNTIMNNKLMFAIFAQRESLRTPNLIGHNLEHHFFYPTRKYDVQSLEDLVFFFEELFKTGNYDKLFVKPLSLYGGQGCFILKRKFLEEQLKNRWKDFAHQSHIFSEVVKQHSDLNKIHSSSLNTLRIITFIKQDGNIEIVSTFLRVGIGDSVVDNGSAGGVYIGIIHETGVLKNYGHKIMKHGGDRLWEHPDSHFPFRGFKIPYYKEACQLVIDSLNHLPERWIGWDVAITPTGPLIIEANDCPDLHMSDVASEGLLKNNTVKNLIKNLKEH